MPGTTDAKVPIHLLDITDGKGSASVVANGVDAVKGTSAPPKHGDEAAVDLCMKPIAGARQRRAIAHTSPV